MPSTSVVINQVATRDAAGALDEFIELRTVSGAQNIGNWTLRACPALGGPEVVLTTIPAGTQMKANGLVGQFFLVANGDASGYSGTPSADRTYSGVAIDDLGGVVLRDSTGAFVDGVGFTDGLSCTETAKALAQLVAEDPLNLANARNVLSTDTDVNAIDFRKLPRNPRNSNS